MDYKPEYQLTGYDWKRLCLPLWKGEGLEYWLENMLVFCYCIRNPCSVSGTRIFYILR